MIFDWIKRLFDKDRPIKKEVGGFEILDGVVLGASYFSKDGKQSSALICPPIWAFNYGITNSLNRLNSVTFRSEILDGVVLGASYFSKDGKQSSALICPPIWAFNYGITNSLNRLNSVTLPP